MPEKPGSVNLSGSFSNFATHPFDPPDDVCKGHGGFMIIKLPVEAVGWLSRPRPELSVGAGETSDCKGAYSCRPAKGSEAS